MVNIILRYFIIPIFIIVQLAKAEHILRDVEIEDVIYDIAKPIIEYGNLSSDRLKIRIINSDVINAFATNDMQIYINTALLIQNIDPSMITGVLAHEIGHLKGAHLSQRAKKSQEAIGESLGLMLLGGLASMSTNNPDPLLGSAVLAAQFYERSALKFNRGQESQADNFALSAIKKLHYPCEGFLNFFRSSRNNESSLEINSYGSTHPSNQDRIDHIESYIKNNNLPKNIHLSPEIEKKFRRAFIKLKAYLTEEEENINLITSNMSEEEKKYASAIFWYKKNSFKKAAEYIKKLILARENDPFYRELFSEILYAQGDIKQAINEMVKVHYLIPDNCLINIELANYEIQYSSYKEISSTEKEKLLNQAITRLKFIITKEEDNDVVYRLLARAYGNKKQFALSNLYLAKEAFVINDYNNSILFAERAKKSLKEESSEFWEADSILKEAQLKKRNI